MAAVAITLVASEAMAQWGPPQQQPPPQPGYGPPPGGGYGPPPGGGYGPPPGGGYGPPPGGGYGPPPGGGYGPPPGGYGPPPGGGYGPPPGGGYGQPPPPSKPKETPGGIVVAGLGGVRGTYTDSNGRNQDDGFGLGVAGFTTALLTWDFLVGKAGFDLHLGGTENGFIGRAAAELAGGGIYHVGHEHGAFARLGARAQYDGDGLFVASTVEIPTLFVGYQLHLEDVYVEGGLRAGPVWLGHYQVDGVGRRDLGIAPEWGAGVTAAAGPAFLDATFERLEDDAAWHRAAGKLCVAYGIGLCGDANVYFGDVPRPLGSVDTATVVYFGVLLGFGDVFEDTSKGI